MGENRIMQDLYEENQKLKARVAELEAQHFSECGQIAHYSDELAEAKRLLQCAANDIQNIDKKGRCSVCKYDLRNIKKGLIGKCCGCFLYSQWKWLHESEILNFLKGDKYDKV